MGSMKLKIAELIEKKGQSEKRYLTIKEVASDIGVTAGTLGRMVSNKNDRWEVETLGKLYDYFGCKSIDELIEHLDK